MKPDEAATDQSGKGSEALRALLGKSEPERVHDGSDSIAASQAGTDADADTAEEEVILQMDGVDQRFTKSDLVKQLAEAKKVAEAKAALNDTLSELTASNEVVQAFKALPEDAQARIREMMRDPTRLEQPRESDDDDESNLIEKILGDRNTVETRGIKALKAEMADRDEVLKHVASFVQNELQSRQRASVEQEVENHMRGLPIFEGDDRRAAYARQLAKSSILAQFTASGGKADMRDLVVGVASQVQQLLSESDRQQDIDQDEFVVSDGRVSPRERMTADDLMAGKGQERVRRLLNRMSSGRGGL